MEKTVVIVQSCYIPWKGYFDLIHKADEFILYDDMQYTKRDWRNRNVIKTPTGLLWLTIPVQVKGKYFQRICDTKIDDPAWGEKHWNRISQNYSKARYFREYRDLFESLYRGTKEEYLSRVNYVFLRAICDLLGIATKLTWSMDYDLTGEQELRKTERLVALCKAAKATHYISGPSAKDYIVKELFDREGIMLSYMDYSGYPEYTQQYGKFEHGVSIVDLLFNEGPNARKFMKS
jgi:hypothetical protein